ncbi:ImmA/IrrE family metallo-endopeptidase [Streptomyces chartreusis]|uniref:ImmA/IrrE family metallo-endopeptidase n=1 Tax=Streptomyces chartreusis TaxID=1969 RepID=A0A7H8TP62_STRCX|nr:ImmA/IrrE family metallo-endopeptidase [Streptomyces chartreusis]QKZ23910.1 ImmA/IrrE family metallo-endopeptidase [Streptomyces chartreusis]
MTGATHHTYADQAASSGARRSRESLASLREQLVIRREMRRMARIIRRDVGLSGVRDIDSLVEVVSVRRGRPISVLFLPLPAGVSAFCFSTPTRDYIVVDAAANELTRIHAIAHELGHFLLDGDERATGTPGHDGDDPISRELAVQIVPALYPDGVVKLFKRSNYGSAGERRVEVFATMMLQRHIALRRGKGKDGLAATFVHRRGTGV